MVEERQALRSQWQRRLDNSVWALGFHSVLAVCHEGLLQHVKVSGSSINRTVCL